MLYAITLMLGFYVWQWQMLRGGHTRKQAERFLTMGVIAVIGGARLGHCLFYEPERYLKDPIRILYFWEGGLASHGSTVALIAVLIYFARTEKMPIREVLDRFSMSAAVGATLIRFGNLMNSEIVGRITDGPFAAKFPRHDRDSLVPCPEQCGQVADSVCGFINGQCFAQVPWRHPSQLYEGALGIGVFLMLYLVDRHYGEKRPLGLLGFLFIGVYFTGRFIVEFFKEFQSTLEDQGSLLTMGQYLSIPFIIVGFLGVYDALRRPRQTPPPAKV
ncbi:MAG: prolipoprotein diacylglyceryl transferase [Myxococcales bacterium]|nr:prolipoprotein diacylglyceryl transferase [Myxococcales bacterium]